jgi:hypothetical protein
VTVGISKVLIEESLSKDVDWEEIDLEGARFTDEPDALYATHKGVFKIGAAEIRTYQLNNGERVLDADDVIALFTPPAIPDGRS